MKVTIAIRGDTVAVFMRAENSNGTIGDLFRHIHPGQDFFGWTYRELLSLGSGEHTLAPKRGAHV